MFDSPQRPFDENDLHALADGQLSPERAQAVRAQLGADQAERVAHWAAQRAQLQSLYASIATEPLPDVLLTAANRLQALQDRQTQLWRWGGMAASVLLAFGLGWTLHGQWSGQATSAPLPMASEQRFA